MKNYIANDSGGWATSAGYVKYSFSRSIHFGRLYTNGAGGSRGKEADLCEALRCLGQGLHCMEVSQKIHSLFYTFSDVAKGLRSPHELL